MVSRSMYHDDQGLTGETACRTEQISAEISSCLSGLKRYRCDYAFHFGEGYLCTHPKHREFR
jgi:hypothetical protein